MAIARDDDTHRDGNAGTEISDVSVQPDEFVHSRGAEQEIALEVVALNSSFGDDQVLFDVNLQIPKRRLTSLIGPSGSGKTTLLRCFNRLNDLIEGHRTTGQVNLEGRDIYGPGTDLSELRRRVGMVFQRPSPFPKSIYENVAYGLRIQGIRKRNKLDDAIACALKAVGLWNEVKGRLHRNAYALSSGQQQRLVIARALALRPEILLLDEPASALDPISTLKLEELLYELKARYTIILVTHNLQHSARVSDYTAFLDSGRVIEFADTDTLFTNPGHKMTEDYITGRYG